MYDLKNKNNKTKYRYKIHVIIIKPKVILTQT